MTYLDDIFYKTSKLTKPKVRELFVEAKELCYTWWVDDQPDWQRRKIDMSFKDVLKIFDKTPRKKLHIVIIHRRGFDYWDQHLEIGFSTLARKKEENSNIEGDVFLWIRVDLEHKEYLLLKYNLEIL
jgi:hypothetical protein